MSETETDGWFESLPPDQQADLMRRIEESERDHEAGRVYGVRRVLGFWITVRSPAWPKDDPDRPRKLSVMLAPRGFRWMTRVRRAPSVPGLTCPRCGKAYIPMAGSPPLYRHTCAGAA